MANFGYTSGDEWTRVRAFTDANLGSTYSSAFATFVGNNTGSTFSSPTKNFGGLNGFASYSWMGNFDELLSDPGGCRCFLESTAAHEVGHIFFACDEYGYCNCADCAADIRPPGTSAPNYNCVAGSGCGIPVVSCIMRDSAQAFTPRNICTYTAQHIGWPAVPCFNVVATYDWSATYYNDVFDATSGTWSHWTQGAVSRWDEGNGMINHDWGTGSPSSGPCLVNSDHFSARYTRYVTFTEGYHTFTATTDDGLLLMVDSTTVIDAQFSQPPTTYSNSVYLAAGTHLVKVYYFEDTGAAALHVSWN